MTGASKSRFFFFQAEDGIRDYKVTGVQTCALPILGDAVDWNTVVLGQDATDPDRRSHLVLRRTDAFSDQVLRRADVGVGVDVDARVPKETRREDGYGDEGPLLREQRHGVRRE